MYYKGAINLINLRKTFTSVTDAFFALHSFSQIEHVGLSQKSAGMHLLYFYQVILDSRNINYEGKHGSPQKTIR